MHVTQRWQVNTHTHTQTQRTGDIWCSDDVTAVMQWWPVGVKAHIRHICAHVHKDGHWQGSTAQVIGCLIDSSEKQIGNYFDNWFTASQKNPQLLFVVHESKFNIFGFKSVKTSFGALRGFDGHFFLIFWRFIDKTINRSMEEITGRWICHESNCYLQFAGSGDTRTTRHP